MSNSSKGKPNDNSSNVDRIRDIIKNTEGNLMDAEFSKEFVNPVQREIIREKNERRKYSIEELKEEIKEEVTKGKRGKA
ncbi:small acid-soluble spore protein Tlp [Lysinibacillus sp. 2017]|uniref:small acid-soluble spore protein Tlp n=1 Tax=unclassified Lysinibacillus TaxID=2636778 RepID=UPI000D52617A|nr:MULTISPECIES: small acid-soluble spore protein Tlp [unclassified Lysinibacillus]AWE08782.1 small acid-soluble spore protein Tlp [Lysinibacillus sp. 2017]TGN36105.1 small acid-soluble spore protein Tlp [Lysinibacillus sp. S2017]